MTSAPTIAPAAPPAPWQSPLNRRDRALTLAGVLISLLLAALDQTIVATAGPAIQRDLGIQPALYAWITTAYLVASTVMVPIYGKLSDRFGRRPILLAGIVLFLLGSGLCGLAPTAFLLIAARAVQGLGAASLFTTTFAVIADLYPPAERGRYTGLIGGVMGIASVVGPLVGGFITDTFGWHWVFFINLPLGVVALWVVARFMPHLSGTPRGQRLPLDVAGAAWLVAAVIPLLLAFSLGRAGTVPTGDGFPWGSWQILTLFGVAIVSAVAFIMTERRAQDPVLHLELFRNRVIGLGAATMFVIGGSFLFAVVFLPLYLVNVVGVSATRAGLTMMPLTLGAVAGAIGSGQIAARLGRYKALLLGGLVLLAAGFLLMGTTLHTGSTERDVTVLMILLGLGVGPTMPLYTLAMQAAAPVRQIGVVTAVASFSRALGQVIGVALFGTLFATTLASAMARETAAVLQPLPANVRALVASESAPGAATRRVTEEGGGLAAFDAAALKQQVRVRARGSDAEAPALRAVDDLAEGYRRAFTRAVSILYLVAIVMVVVGFVLTAMTPELRLTPHVPEAAVAALE